MSKISDFKKLLSFRNMVICIVTVVCLILLASTWLSKGNDSPVYVIYRIYETIFVLFIFINGLEIIDYYLNGANIKTGVKKFVYGFKFLFFIILLFFTFLNGVRSMFDVQNIYFTMSFYSLSVLVACDRVVSYCFKVFPKKSDDESATS